MLYKNNLRTVFKVVQKRYAVNMILSFQVLPKSNNFVMIFHTLACIVDKGLRKWKVRAPSRGPRGGASQFSGLGETG